MPVVKSSSKSQKNSAFRKTLRRRRFPPPQGISHSSSQGKPALTADQHDFDLEQNQSRRWLHWQINLPDSNGISKWHHSELFSYFTKPTLEERERPPIFGEDIEVVTMCQQHLARLTQQRNNEKQKLGLALNMTTHVEDWWDKGPIPANRVKPNAGEKRPRPDNKRTRRLHQYMEKKKKEAEEQAIAKEKQTMKDMSGLQIRDEVGQANVTHEEGEDFDEEEVAMEGIEEQEEDIAPHRWAAELTFRGSKP